MALKNETLYNKLFKLRQIIEIPTSNCRTLQYAVNLNLIGNINLLMNQLYDSENLSSVDMIFETEYITTKPTLKDVVDVKNHLFYFSSFLSEFSNYDSNFNIIAKTIDDMTLFIETYYLLQKD